MKAISATFPVTAKLSDFPFYNIEHRSDLVHHYHNHSQQNPTCMIIVCVPSIFVVQYTDVRVCWIPAYSFRSWFQKVSKLRCCGVKFLRLQHMLSDLITHAYTTGTVLSFKTTSLPEQRNIYQKHIMPNLSLSFWFSEVL